MSNYYYKAYGIEFESEIELPELVYHVSRNPIVSIKYGAIPQNLPKVSNSGVMFQVSPNDFLLRIKNIGAYRVQNGKEITISPINDSIIKEFRLFLLGSAFGALLHQRGILPLHGSAIQTEKGAIIIAGDSAVGKSSLAAGLALKGYPILADDISAIHFDCSNNLTIHPGIPHLKLWKDVLSYFKADEDQPQVRPNLEKYRYPLGSYFSQQSAKISKVVFLSTINSPQFYFNDVFGSRKFELLRSVVYRQKFIDGLGLEQSNFQKLSKLASQAEAIELKRPIKPLLIYELVEYFQNNLISK